MDTFSQFIKELGTARLVASIAALALFFIIAAIYFFNISNNNLVTLYSDLELSDSNKIVQELEAKNIPYELSSSGSIIKVPDEFVLKLRMEMAESGLPSRGNIVGYEIFDKGEGFGTSNFMQNVNLVRALEGELSRTISSFDNVEKARVHLVIPKKQLFSKERQIPRSSIVLKLSKRSKLKKYEIEAIAHLVATAVPELEPSNITIVDTKGSSLKLGAKDENDVNNIASKADEFKQAYELRLKNIIEDLLEQSVGVGKVKAYVNADMNFDRIVTNSEIYDPDATVVRSQQSVEERDKQSSSNGGALSVTTNLPNAANNAENSGNNSERLDTTTNYEISKTIKNFIGETGKLNRLSVAVLIDGNYEKDAETGKPIYKPRNDNELNQYKSLIKSAIGYRAERKDSIELISMQFVNEFEGFEDEDMMSHLSSELPTIIRTFIFVVAGVLVIFYVIKPMALRAFDVKREDLNLEDKDDHLSLITDNIHSMDDKNAVDSIKEAMIDMEKIEAQFKGNQSLKRLNDTVGKFPQETLSLFRKWLSEE